MNRLILLKLKYPVLLVCVWIIATGFGFHVLLTYKSHAGAETHPPSTWPANRLIQLPSEKPLLVMFAHPQCPCTKASLAQLEQLAVLANQEFKAAVVFYQPKNHADDWSNSALIRAAKSIPGVEVIFDSDAALENRFHVETSGHTLIYSPAGHLLFSGGITGSRGHIGANTGFAEVSRIIITHSTPQTCSSIPVFGCELLNNAQRTKH